MQQPIAAVILALPIIYAKLHTREVKLTGAATDPALRWRYVSKFGFGLGVGTSEVRARLAGPSTSLLEDTALQLEIYLDEEWPDAESLPDVCARKDKARLSTTIDVRPDGSFGTVARNTFAQKVRPHIWFFAISDCRGSLGVDIHRVVVELRLQQDGGSEFSYESRWALTTNVTALIVFGLFCLTFAPKCGKFRRTNGALHPVITALTVAIMLQLSGHVSHTWHLWCYAADGVGLPWTEVLSEVFFMMSQVLLASLLLIIALGYTLTRSKVGDLDMIIVASVLVALVHAVLVILGKCRDDDAYKFHEHEGAHGWLLFALRLALWLWFVWAAQSTSAGAGPALQSFLRGYMLVGSVYFLSYPTIFLVVRLFAPYLQNAVLQAGLALTQVASITWLASLFLSKGSYFEVSSLNSSELPRRQRSLDELLPKSWSARLRGLVGLEKKAS